MCSLEHLNVVRLGGAAIGWEMSFLIGAIDDQVDQAILSFLNAKPYGADLHDLEIDIEEISFGDSICVIREGKRTFQNRRHITGNQFHVVD